MSEQPRRRRRQQMPSDELNREEIRVEKQNPSSISEERPSAIQTSISKPRKKKKKSKQGIVVVIAVFVITLIVGLLAISYFAITANSRQTIVSEVLSTPSPVFELMPTATPTLTPTESPIQSDESTVSIPVIHEEFSIRNGINFGMKKTEVIKKEQEHGNTEGKLFRNISIAKKTAELQNWTTYLVDNQYIVQSQIVGNSGLVIYSFNSDDEMNSLRYLVESGFNSTPLTDSLVAKYGKPLFTDGTAPFDSHSLNYYHLSNNREIGATLLNYAGWLVKFDNTYVCIESVQFACYDYEYYYYENITYTPISEDLFNLYQESLVNQQQSFANDI